VKILRNKLVLFFVGYVVFFVTCLLIYGDHLPIWLMLSLFIPFGLISSMAMRFTIDRAYEYLPTMCPACGKPVMQKSRGLRHCPYCSADL
jgi:hypothetical protein